MALRIPQFHDLDKITADTYRTYVARISDPDRRRYAEQSMGSGAEYDAAVREADQLDATLADPSRRARMVSPFQARYDALREDLKARRNRIIMDIRSTPPRARRRGYNDMMFATASAYNLNADINQNDVNWLRGQKVDHLHIANMYGRGERVVDRVEGEPSAIEKDVAIIVNQFPELGPLRDQIDAFNRAANAGITNSMSAAERADMQARAVAARGRAEELSSAMSQRLKQALASYNTDQMRGVVAAGVGNTPEVRRRARFSGRAPGVGISIGGMG